MREKRVENSRVNILINLLKEKDWVEFNINQAHLAIKDMAPAPKSTAI